jgi:hypothetical protein
VRGGGCRARVGQGFGLFFRQELFLVQSFELRVMLSLTLRRMLSQR